MRRHALGLIAALSLTIGITTPPAMGQFEMSRSVFVSEGPGPTGDATVSRAKFQRYLDLLTLDEAQAEAALVLHEIYTDERRALAQSMMEQMRTLGEGLQDADNLQERLGEMGRLSQQQSEASERLENTLFDDIQLLLTEDQAARWPALDRARRRDRMLPGARMSGASVDLVGILRDLGIGDAIAEQVELYEIEMDRELQSRERLMAAQSKDHDASRVLSFDPDSMAEMHEKMNEMRECTVRLRETNRRHARILEAAIEESVRPEFRDRVKRASHPRIFRESQTDRILRAAAGFGDLTPEQQNELATLAADYSARRALLDDRWAVEADKSDEDGSPLGMASGGMSMMIMVDDGAGESKPSPADEARSSRRALDQEIADRVRGMLDEEQVARLPKRRAFDLHDGMPGGEIDGAFISGEVGTIIIDN